MTYSIAFLCRPPYELDAASREAVVEGLRESCAQNGWRSLAMHADAGGAAIVVDAPVTPERVLGELDVHANRALDLLSGGRNPARWLPHTAPRWLFSEAEVQDEVLAIASRS